MREKYFGNAIKASIFAMFVASACVSGQAESYAGEMDNAAILRLNAVKQAYLATQRGTAVKVKAGIQVKDSASKASLLVRVQPDEVNMAINHYEGAKQNKVVIDGKDYYAGARGYVTHISANPSTRFSKDPFTGKPVDKAEAVIYADASSRAHYFESENTYKAFIGLAKNDVPRGYTD